LVEVRDARLQKTRCGPSRHKAQFATASVTTHVAGSDRRFRFGAASLSREMFGGAGPNSIRSGLVHSASWRLAGGCAGAAAIRTLALSSLAAQRAAVVEAVSGFCRRKGRRQTVARLD